MYAKNSYFYKKKGLFYFSNFVILYISAVVLILSIILSDREFTNYPEKGGNISIGLYGPD